MITKQKTLAIIGLTTLVLISAGGFLWMKAWEILYFGNQPPSGGCSCDAGFFTARLTYTDMTAIVLAIIFAAGIIFGAIYFLATLIKTRNFIKKLPIIQKLEDQNLPLAAREINGKITVFKSDRAEAFTYGFLRPKIAISSASLENFSAEELKAILLHEFHHLKNRDTLVFLILDTLKIVFFFAPMLRNLVEFYKTISEIKADLEIKNKQTLGKIILQFTGKTSSEVGIAPFASSIKDRINHLLNGREPKFNFGKHACFLVIFLVIFTWLISGSKPKQNTTFNQCFRRQTTCVNQSYGASNPILLYEN